MERSRYHRLTGVIFVVGSLFGLIIAIGGLYALWSTRDRTVRGITNVAGLLGRTLDSTQETIRVVNASLDQATKNLELIRDIATDVASTLDDSQGLVSSTAGLVGNDLVEFVHETQSSLASVETSARLVDDTLRIVSYVPLIGPRYQPEIPLQESVAQVSESMNPLPDSFGKISRQLDVSAANLSTVRFEVEALATQVEEIDASITRAKDVVEDYRVILAEFQARYDVIEDDLPLALNLIYFGLTSLLVWMLITQLGMLIHGLEILT